MEKTFKNDFYKFLNKLKNKENFSFCKFSDGELYIMQNKQLILGPDAQYHSYVNNEDFKEFLPERDSFYRNKLIDAFKYKHKDYYIGIYGVSDDSLSTFNWMRENSGRVDENLTWANLFVNSNYPLFRDEMINEFCNHEIIIVCNEKCNFDKLPFKHKIKKDFRVGQNCIINNYDLIEKIKNYIQDEKIENHLFLFAASSLGNFLCHQLHDSFKNNTYFDVGSTLNPLLGLSIDRGYLAAYEKVLWRGYQDTSSDLTREEEWLPPSIALVSAKGNKEYYEFIRLLRNDERVQDGFIERANITREQQEEYMKKYASNYFVCLYNNVPAGFIGEIDGDIRVATHPDYQKNGLGKFMVDELFKITQNVYAKIKIKNEASLNLFEKAGFEKKYYILEKNGK